MLKKAVVLGGGFNPIGLHHEEMAARIWDKVQAPVWLMPCYDHRFSKNSDLIDSSHRWNMVVEAVGAPVTNRRIGLPCEMVACDWEIANKHGGSMFETMDGLTEKFPDIEFSIAIGMDNARVMTLPKEEGGWDRGSQLIERFTFIVFKRAAPGQFDIPEWVKPPHTLIDFDNPMSSSGIREMIRNGWSSTAAHYLNPRVWDYIQMGRLYGHKSDTA